MTSRASQPIERLLVPTDFSSASLVAVQVAVNFANAFNASITLHHVLTMPNPMIAIVPGASVAEESAVDRSAAVRSMARIVAELHTAGFTRIETIIEASASNSRCILERARSGLFDLIVMATHGRTGISRAVLGSVAEVVLRTASCPVLTVRP